MASVPIDQSKEDMVNTLETSAAVLDVDRPTMKASTPLQKKRRALSTLPNNASKFVRDRKRKIGEEESSNDEDHSSQPPSKKTRLNNEHSFSVGEACTTPNPTMEAPQQPQQEPEVPPQSFTPAHTPTAEEYAQGLGRLATLEAQTKHLVSQVRYLMHKADQWEERNIAYENIVDAMEDDMVRAGVSDRQKDFEDD